MVKVNNLHSKREKKRYATAILVGRLPYTTRVVLGACDGDGDGYGDGDSDGDSDGDLEYNIDDTMLVYA
jgi:hypothetical protein